MDLSIIKYLIRKEQQNQITQKENNEVFMNITVKKQDLQKLAQFIYLGNTVINGYKKNDEINVEYEQFAQDIYKQIMKFIPEKKSKYIFKNLPNERSTEAKIADFSDRIYDSVQDYYLDFQNALFCDLADRQGE
jgi:hypothetical protein